MSVDTLDTIYTVLLYGCALGQVFFVVAWLTVAWYTTAVGLATMFMSFCLTSALVTVATLRFTTPQFSPETGYKIYIAMFTAMFLGIFVQDLVLLRELFKRKKEVNDR